MRIVSCGTCVAVLLLSLAGVVIAQDGPRVKGRTVLISGENPFIELSSRPDGPATTNVSFWRVVYSPVGMGHACYLTSDVTGNGPSSDDLRVVLTDSETLVDYLNRDIMSIFNKAYAEKPFPVIKAAFARHGDTLKEYREVIRSEKHTVELVWKSFYPTVLLEIPVGAVTISTTLIPARVAEVHINRIKAVGSVFPRREGTAEGSTGALALCETWVK
jgi:hypothetical protein